jgi:Tol biopolymer transport system component
LLAAAAALWLAFRDRPSDTPRLAWVVTAHQLGPVGYRDPAGAISPDGKSIAYSEGRFLRVRSVDGGPSIELPAGDAQIRSLSWNPDNHTVLADGDRGPSGWAMYDVAARARHPFATSTSRFASAVWAPDGKRIAAIVNGTEGQELRIITAEGATESSRSIRVHVTSAAWTPAGEVACVATDNGRSRLTIPCGGHIVSIRPPIDVYGPIAFSADGQHVYFGSPNPYGTLDVWIAPANGGWARRLTSFARDTYAPSASRDGVLFKAQSYRTHVALAPAEGGTTSPLAVFQTETPSWDPTGRWIGVTYGSWRRVVDDAHYPDIAQDAGIIAVDASNPASAPSSVVHASPSEDQSLCWSPNGRWIAFHSHKDQSDDIWLRAAEGGEARRITFLGRGAETGWPRWSRDGRTVLFTGAGAKTHRTIAYTIDVDQETGKVMSDAREIPTNTPASDVMHAEWLPDNVHVVAIEKESPGHHAIVYIRRDGSDARIVRQFASEHDNPGLAVAPDGTAVAFIAPGGDGFFQVFRMPLNGGDPVQVTTDPSNKTQPAWSPDGRRIAFTIWNYDANFYLLK